MDIWDNEYATAAFIFLIIILLIKNILPLDFFFEFDIYRRLHTCVSSLTQ